MIFTKRTQITPYSNLEFNFECTFNEYSRKIIIKATGGSKRFKETFRLH